MYEGKLEGFLIGYKLPELPSKLDALNIIELKGLTEPRRSADHGLQAFVCRTSDFFAELGGTPDNMESHGSCLLTGQQRQWSFGLSRGSRPRLV